MAKKPDDLDEFSMEHDGGSDFMEDDKPAKPGKSGTAGSAGKGGGPLGGILAKLPIAGLAEKVGGAVGNVRSSVSSSFHDSERPTLPIVLLGGGVLFLVMVLIVMVVLLVGSLSGDGGQSGAYMVEGTGSSGSEQTTAAKPAGHAATEEATEGIAPDENAATVSNGSQRNLLQSMARDPLVSKAILPDEAALMRDGEIRYGRVPQKFWSLDDIRPGWQELNRLYRVMLRERNTRDFYRLLGADEPKADTY